MSEYYYPTIWAYETHILTPLANFLRGLLPELKYHRYIEGQIEIGDRDVECFSHIETLINITLTYTPTHAHREYVRTPDGGQISLDWYDPDVPSEDCSSRQCNSKVHCDYNRPIALFLPGLTGCSQAEYIKTLGMYFLFGENFTHFSQI